MIRIPAILALLILLLHAGCQIPISTSAQAGSTVLIPLDSDRDVVGYGGTQATDPQRGTLVWTATGPSPAMTPYDLTTRFTIKGGHDARSLNATDTAIARYEQVVSVVDLPSDLPSGVYTLEVKRHHLGGISEVRTPPVTTTLRVLPASVMSGGETIVGAPTPLEGWGWLGDPPDWTDLSGFLQSAIPRPVLWIDSSVAVSSASFHLTLPPGRVQVVDVVPQPGLNHASLWHEVLPDDRVRVVAAAAGDTFTSVGVVFDLIGTTPLETSEVGVDSPQLGDRFGKLVSGATLSPARIR